MPQFSKPASVWPFCPLRHVRGWWTVLVADVLALEPMAYRFKHDESFSDGLHRIGKEQLRQACGGLELAPDDAAVHAAG